MSEKKEKLYLVSEKALPQILLQVMNAKRILETERDLTVAEATERVGISRSSFYKYKDDVNSFYDNTRGKTISFLIQMKDEQGLLSKLLGEIAKFGVNVLTIHQSIPVNGIASISLSIEVTGESNGMTELMENINRLDGVQFLKVLAKE